MVLVEALHRKADVAEARKLAQSMLSDFMRDDAQLKLPLPTALRERATAKVDELVKKKIDVIFFFEIKKRKKERERK